MPNIKPNDIVILGAKRTAMGSFQGQFADLAATRLGAIAIKAALAESGLKEEQIGEVLMGQVLNAGCGQAPARQAAIHAGLPDSIPCTTISKVCGSGMKTVMLAFDQIKAESISCAVAGGMESMTQAPYLLPKAREGFRLGHGQCLDHMFFDGLQDAYCGELMGHFADANAIEDGITREEMDQYTLASLQRAQQAITKGLFRDEICPVNVTQRRETKSVDTDELPGQARPEKIPQLKPAFGKDGRVTAANASSISDGAAALVICSAAHADHAKAKPLAIIRGHASHAEKPSRFTHAPIGAINKLLNKLAWKINEIDLFEVNEAFAMVALAGMRGLGIPHERINIHGGACALGHPIGASGARILVTLIHALRQSGGKRGVASLCIGGGEATAMAIELL